MLTNFLMRTLQCAENLIMYIFAHKNMKKPPFSKIAVIFRTVKNSAVCPRPLKTRIAFSMFPILDFNMPKYVIPQQSYKF